ncbi:MAG: hypothetical protein QNJ63_20665 [Calothrix sp. MO_192.B10]|nr:hypothetical protein [Calothrix sp. MO_192.B10]
MQVVIIRDYRASTFKKSWGSGKKGGIVRSLLAMCFQLNTPTHTHSSQVLVSTLQVSSQIPDSPPPENLTT